MMGGKESLSMASRQQEAAQLADELRVAYGITRQQNDAAKKRAKAKDRAAQRRAERR